jgi:hypothetical protein
MGGINAAGVVSIRQTGAPALTISPAAPFLHTARCRTRNDTMKGMKSMAGRNRPFKTVVLFVLHGDSSALRNGGPLARGAGTWHGRSMAGQGSSGNVIAALASFFIPGLGQLIQGRPIMALVMFVLAGALWIILLGWIIHLWSILDAARFRGASA